LIKIIKHNQIDFGLMSEIANIKSLSWNYPIQEQIDWMNRNLNANDLHFLSYNDDGILVGYLNIINSNIRNNNEIIEISGIGNVCVKFKGSGDGKRLILELNKYLIKYNLKGVLFCKKELIGFYSLFEWNEVPTLHSDPIIHTMIFNFGDIKLGKLEFSGTYF